MLLAGQVVLAGGTALCFLPRTALRWSSAATRTEYSPFLTISEALISLWTLVSGYTLLTKADWLYGATVAITNASGYHVGPKF